MIDTNDDTVERVARAIYESHGFVKPWDHPHTIEKWHHPLRKEARAAISALQQCESTIVDNLSEEITALRGEADVIVAAVEQLLANLSTGDPEIWGQIWIAENYSKLDLVHDVADLLKPAPPETGD